MLEQTLKPILTRSVYITVEYQIQTSNSSKSYSGPRDVLQIRVKSTLSIWIGRASIRVRLPYNYNSTRLIMFLFLVLLSKKCLLNCFLLKGKGRAVLKPKTVQEVSKILAYCNERRLPVVPQGGNTSQVGSAVPVEDELIMSMSLMRAVLSFSPDSGVLVAEAGCVLGELQELAAREGLVVPLDLGAKGSCMIGGNVSTHAGGKRLIRYGNLHGSVLGLEAVRTALVHDFMYSAMLSAIRLTVHEQVMLLVIQSKNYS